MQNYVWNPSFAPFATFRIFCVANGDVGSLPETPDVVWFEGISGQAGLGRITRGGNATEGLTERLVSAEREAGFHERDMSSFECERIDLEHRVNRMEAELEALRKRRLEAYARWWNARDDRDRALHVCRRLRRRIDRTRRRESEG